MRLRNLLLAVVLLAPLALPAAAQRTGSLPTPQKSFTITFQSNAPNSVYFVDNEQIKGDSIVVTAGIHSFRVTAPGYDDYIKNVDVRSDLTIDAKLFEQNATLVVNPNVAGAVLYVDGVQVKGLTIVVRRGNHTVRLVAPGFGEYTSTVNVTGAMTLAPQLVAQNATLTVNANVAGAYVFVDGAQIKGNAVVVTLGNHAVRVTAPGFQDYNSTVNVTGPMTIQAQLAALSSVLSVSCNVNGAILFVDGAQIKGFDVTVLQGNHTIRVTAPGYTDYQTTVTVAGPMTLNAQLTPTLYALSVTSNVQGAAVSINGVAKGQTPYTEALPPGAYAVIVSAPGYTTYSASLNLTAAMAVAAQLQPAQATVTIVLPPNFLDPQNREAPGLVKILIDGKLMNARRDVSGIQIAPGKHRIAVSSGGLLVQSGDVDFAPGINYTIELHMDLQVKAAQ